MIRLAAVAAAALWMTGAFAAADRGTVKRGTEAADGLVAFNESGSVGYKVTDAKGPCEIAYKFKVVERNQSKKGYAFMLHLYGGDASALVSMRDAVSLESYFYRNGKKCGFIKSTGDAKHPDGAWHEVKVSVGEKTFVVMLDGHEIGNGQHSGFCPVEKFDFWSYGLKTELKDVTHRTLEVEKPVLVEKPTYELERLTDDVLEAKLDKPFDAKVGGIMFWARRPAGSREGALFKMCRGKEEVVRADIGGESGNRANIWVKRTDDKKGLVYTRSYLNRMGDWVLVTLTWNEFNESKYFINTLPYLVCFNPGQRMPDFLHADVDGVDGIVFPELKRRGTEIRRLKVFHRPVTNTEVWNEYRRFVPVDMVMNETIVPENEAASVTLQVGPAGLYTRPCPVQLDGLKPAGKVAFDLVVRDAKGETLATDRQEVAVNGAVDLRFPARTYAKGNYTLEVTVNGFYRRTFGFAAFTSDYRPDCSAADRERGELLYAREPKADDKDLLKQGAVAMRETPVGAYLECGNDQTDRISFEIGFPPEVCGQPVELEIEWPDDKPRLAGFYMYAPHGANRDYLQQAVSSGYEIPLSRKMQKSTFLFFPGMTNYLFEARTLAPHMPAAMKAIRIYRVKGGLLPANRIETPKGMPGRHFGFYDEDQTFHNNLNAQAMTKGSPCREAYRAKYPTGIVWATDELYRYFDYIGMDTVSEPTWRYHISYFPLEGQTGASLWPGRDLAWIWTDFPKRGKRFIASLNFGNLPDIKWADKIDGDYLKRGMEMLDRSGDPIPGYLEGARTANPCHPKCVELFLNYLRDPVRRYAKSGLAGIQYEIVTWGTWGKLSNGYDDFTTGKFAKETGIRVPEKVKERYAYLTGEKREAWLKWRAAQITNLVRAMRTMLDEINPELVLELIVPAGKTERYVERGLDVEAIKRIPNVVFCVTRAASTYRHNMHWSQPESTLNEDLFDFTKADAADLAVNGAVASVRSSYSYFETFVNPLKTKPYSCYFENADAKPWGRHFLREAAYSLAAYDMLEYTSGAQPLPSVGHEAESREFARAFRFLPAKPFEDVPGVRDPAVARYLKTANGTYWYVVNTFHEPIVVKLDLGGWFKEKLTLKAYEVRSGLVGGKQVDVKDLELVSVDPNAETFYAARLAELDDSVAELKAAGVEVDAEAAWVADLKALKAQRKWSELYRRAYARIMNQLVAKRANVKDVLAEQRMAKTGAWKVNCGQSRYYHAPDGAVFLPDVAFNGKYGYVAKGTHYCASREVTGIHGTDLPELFKSESYWLGCYRFKVPNGKYRVKIHMKYGFERGFDKEDLLATSVLANGKPIWNDVDFREAQGRDFRKALLCTAEVEVSDGEILLEWRPERKSHPSIPLANGIEIEPL